jgi:hypothetical protein
MHVVIMRSGQGLVAFAQRQPMIEKSQARCRVLCQRDVLPVAANVVSDGTADLQRDEHSTVQELKNEVAALTATVKEQAAQIQKVSAQLEASKPAPQVVSNPYGRTEISHGTVSWQTH